MRSAIGRRWGWHHHGSRGDSPRDPAAPGFARRHRRLLIALAVVVAVLIALRLALSPVLEWYVGKVLNETPGYGGSVGDIRLHLIRGAYEIDDLAIHTVAGEQTTPLVTAPQVELSLQWNALLRRKLVGEAVLIRPVVRYDLGAKKPDTPESAKKKPPREGDRQVADDVWQEKVKKLFPVTVNRIELRDAEVRVVDRAKNLDLPTSSLNGEITNLTNVTGESGSQVAHLAITGTSIGGAHIDMSGDIDPLALDPTFSVAVTLTGMDMTALNPLLAAEAGGLDVKRGTLDLYAEIAVKDAQLNGYVKPLIKDLDVSEPREDVKQGVGHAVKEAVAGATAKVLQNQRKDQQAAVVDLSGPLTGPRTNVWHALATTLRNAFVQAIRPGLQGGGKKG